MFFFFFFCVRTICSSEAQRYSFWCWTDIWSLCGRMSAGRIAVEIHLFDNLSTQSFRVVADNKFISSQILTGIKCTPYWVWELRDFSDQIFLLDVSAASWKYKDRLIWSLIWHLVIENLNHYTAVFLWDSSHRQIGELLSQREEYWRYWDLQLPGCETSCSMVGQSGMDEHGRGHHSAYPHCPVPLGWRSGITG